MLSRPAVAFFVYLVVEYLAVTELASAIGGQAVALALIVLTVAGVALFRRAGASLLEASVATAMRNTGLSDDSRDRAPADDGHTADRAMMLFGALLMIIPGIVTGVLGLVLFLPPVRAFARPVVLHRIQPWIRPNLRFSRGVMGFGRDVVDVDIVDDTNDEPPSPRAELR
jgi:UPF0716 protein FxsA